MRLTALALAAAVAAVSMRPGDATAAPAPQRRRAGPAAKARGAGAEAAPAAEPAPSAPPAPAEPPAEPLPEVGVVVERVNDLFRRDASEARFTMKIVTSRYQRDLVLHAFTRGRQEALIVVREPAREAGMATLRSAEGLWSYAPRADRLVRIPSSLLSDSWMGSHFTNDDLMRETDFQRDYDAALAWIDHAGRRVLRLTLRPKPDAPVVWSHVVYHLDPRDDLPLRAYYYDGGTISRTLTFGDARPVNGRRVPFSLRMVPAAKPDESTRLDYQEIRFDGEVDPSLFTQRGLRRGARP